MDEWTDRLESLIGRLERMQLTEYLRFVNDRKRFLLVNLWIGVMRGLGTVIGFTILGAILVALLQRLLTNTVVSGVLEEMSRRLSSTR